MAKVLFVVYVPLTEPEEGKEEEIADVKIDVGKDDKSQQENEEETAELKTETSESDLQDAVKDEKITSDSLNEQSEEIDPQKEEENSEVTANDPNKNIFFKTEEDKKECSEDVVSTKVEAEESDSSAKVKDEDVNVNPQPGGSEEIKKPPFVSLVSEISLSEKVKRVLDDLNVGYQWNLTEQNVCVAMFVADYGSQCEDILRKLSMLQIGAIKGSSVSVFPASISSEEKWVQEEFEETQIKEDELSERVNKFKNSIKSRLVVDQIVNAVKNDAKFTFDYLMLVILASFVALMGLLESSSVVLVASMLISPLMGPILAGVFGRVIRKTELINVGIINELRGLTICVLIGFVFGFIPAGIETGTTSWRSSSEWPTPEMSSRGALRALPVGILIAIPSGAGVALSILGGKVGSLVGVAISASLLPPAVNAGLLWANAIVSAISPPPVQSIHGINPNITGLDGDFYTGHGLTCPSLIDNDYERQYSCSLAKESVILGFISLLLTILNIFCIIVMGVIVLKIKEVAPIPESENEFFCHDIKIARESYITMKGQAAATIRKNWLVNYQKMKSECGKDDDEEEEDEHELDNIIDEVEGSPSVINIYEKMQINPPRWNRILHSTSSQSDKSKRFNFSTPSPREGPENGMELRQRTPQSRTPGTPGSGLSEEEMNTPYFTVHRYIHPHDLLKGESFCPKSGKFLKTLKLPKPSRFMISKVEEELPAEDAKPTTSQPKKKVSLPTVSESSEPEAKPLLIPETSNTDE